MLDGITWGWDGRLNITFVYVLFVPCVPAGSSFVYYFSVPVFPLDCPASCVPGAEFSTLASCRHSEASDFEVLSRV